MESLEKRVSDDLPSYSSRCHHHSQPSTNQLHRSATTETGGVVYASFKRANTLYTSPLVLRTCSCIDKRMQPWMRPCPAMYPLKFRKKPARRRQMHDSEGKDNYIADLA